MPVAQTTIVVAAITTAGVVFVVVWVIALLSGLSKLLTKKNPDGDDDYSVFEREIPDDNSGNGGGYAGENATTNDNLLSGYDDEPAPKPRPRRPQRYSPPQTTFTTNPPPATNQDWQQQIARAQQTQLDKTLTLSFPKFDWDDEDEINPQPSQENASHNKPVATTAHNNAAKRLQHILDSRKGLRAAILASEILGTPKSLRENPDPWEPR